METNKSRDGLDGKEKIKGKLVKEATEKTREIGGSVKSVAKTVGKKSSEIAKKQQEQ